MIKKEWIIWIVVAVIAVGLVVGVILVTQLNEVEVPEETDTTHIASQPTEPSSQETTLPGAETKPSVPEGTKPADPSTPTEPSVPGGIEPTQPNGEENDDPGGFGERPTTPPNVPDDPKPTEPTVPTEPEETEPDQPTEPEGTEPPEDGEMTYKEYLNLTTEEQIAFQNTFPNRNAFKQWYLQAKKEYEEAQQQITIGPNSGLDIGDYINP